VSAPDSAADSSETCRSAASSSARAFSISPVISSVLGLRSDPPVSQPAPTRSPSVVTARNWGRAATRSSAALRSGTTTTSASMAAVAPRNRADGSTRSTAQTVSAGRSGSDLPCGAATSGQSPRTIAARPPSAALSAATADLAAPKLSAATASAAEPSTAATAAS
jgi:hypothetical protein